MDRDRSKRRVPRRTFLRASVTGASAALLAACGTPATTTPTASTVADAASAAASAPAASAPATPLPLPQGSAGKLTVIHRSEYFEAVQTKFRDEVTSYVKTLGVDLDISTANPELFGDFMAKMQAAVQANVPPDLAYHMLSITQMHSLDLVEDVTDVVEELIGKYGAVVPVTAEKNAKIDGKWWAVPYIVASGAWFGRKDLFDAAGIDVQSLDTFDKRRDAALKISDPSKQIWGWGLTINKSGDGQGLIMDVIQAFGGRVVDETGVKVVFNSPETIAGVKWLQETYTSEKYKPMLPPGIESWTDTSNNEAYLAGTVAFTQNQLSVYAKAKKDNNPVFPNTAVLHKPKTNDGKLLETPGNAWFTIFKGSKNIDAAKQVILHMIDPQIFTPMAQEGGGLFLPAYKGLWTEDILKIDPNFALLQELAFNPIPFTGDAYPADPNAAVDGVRAASIPSQMMANVTNGSMSAEEAVKDAHDRIVQLFEEAGLPQS